MTCAELYALALLFMQYAKIELHRTHHATAEFQSGIFRSLTPFPLLNSQSCNTALAANSGCNKTQFKKYDKPAFLLSKNSGRNLDMTDLGGNEGMAASCDGKALNNLRRRSSNSE